MSHVKMPFDDKILLMKFGMENTLILFLRYCSRGHAAIYWADLNLLVFENNTKRKKNI